MPKLSAKQSTVLDDCRHDTLTRPSTLELTSYSTVGDKVTPSMSFQMEHTLGNSPRYVMVLRLCARKTCFSAHLMSSRIALKEKVAEEVEAKRAGANATMANVKEEEAERHRFIWNAQCLHVDLATHIHR